MAVQSVALPPSSLRADPAPRRSLAPPPSVVKGAASAQSLRKVQPVAETRDLYPLGEPGRESGLLFFRSGLCGLLNLF